MSQESKSENQSYPAKPLQVQSNKLLAVEEEPVVDLIYDPYPYAGLVDPPSVRLRVFKSVGTLTFPGGTSQFLYIPYVEDVTDPVSGYPAAAYVEIDTTLDPHVPGSLQLVPTMSLYLPAVPGGVIRHRLLLDPGFSAPVVIPDADVSDYTDSGVFVRFQVRTPVFFYLYWKKISPGVDPFGARDFFVQQ